MIIVEKQLKRQMNTMRRVSELAGMYATERGETQNLSKAISMIRYAIEVNLEYRPSYYGLGLFYNQLQKI